MFKMALRLPRYLHTNFDLNNLSEVLLDKTFRNLNGVQRRTFTKIVRHHPEVQPALMTDIRANAAYEHGISAGPL